MSLKRPVCLVLLCGLAVLLPVRSRGDLADVAAGQQRYADRCSGCHGADAVNNVNFILHGASKLKLLGLATVPTLHGGGFYPFTNSPAFDNTDFNNVAAYIGSRDLGSYTVQGAVQLTNGLGISNILITFFSGYNNGATTPTGSNGNYQVTGLRPGDYDVTPSSFFYTFTPTTRSLTMTCPDLVGGCPANQSTSGKTGGVSNLNFTATFIPISISGVVKTPGGQAISGVAVAIPGKTNITDAAGAYRLTDLATNTHTVVPAKAGFIFVPPSATVEMTETFRTATVNFLGGTSAVARVKKAGGNDANDGASWATAKGTVAGGIAAALQEVWVAKGTYLENIELLAGLGLYGGFAGSETNRNERNAVTNKTTLDGNNGGGSARVVDMLSQYDGGATKSVIDGFTIMRGGNVGAGIRVRDTGQTVSNNRITNNTSGGFGGGIWVSGGSPLIISNTIVGNHAGSSGGGIYCDGAPVILNNVISGNVAQTYGGGIAIREGVVADNVIAQNRAPSSGGGGGGLYCSIGAAQVVNNSIVGNTAALGLAPTAGGILSDLGATPTVVNNIIAFNSAGIANTNAGSPILRNNCVFGNTNFNYRGVASGTNDISADPLLVNRSVGDFHLLSGSPCINAGDDNVVSPGAIDLDGQPRIQGAHVDIGAFEVPVPLMFIGSTTNLIISWPASASGYVLEVTDDLSATPIVWQLVSQTPVLVGDQLTVTIAFSAPGEFYRLRKL